MCLLHLCILSEYWCSFQLIDKDGMLFLKNFSAACIRLAFGFTFGSWLPFSFSCLISLLKFRLLLVAVKRVKDVAFHSSREILILKFVVNAPFRKEF